MSYITNNTIRLRAEFKAFTGTPQDPANLVMNIYNDEKRLIESIPVSAGDKIGPGIYEKDYTIPHGRGDLIIEFSGIMENTPIASQYLITREG